MEPGSHLILGPMTTHSVRNDEEDDCIMLTTLIADEAAIPMSPAATSSHSFVKKKKNNFVYKNSLENSLMYSSNNARIRRKLRSVE